MDPPIHRETFGRRTHSYFIDWIVVLVLLILSLLTSDAFGLVTIFERDFHLNDPKISHPRRPEQISSAANLVVAIGAPVVLLVAIAWLRRSWITIHHGILALGLSSGLTRLVTVFIKAGVGSLRPDFLARCNWDVIKAACTGNPTLIRNGRQSFPSGHSSSIFAGMTFISLFFAGITGAWCLCVPPPTSIFIRSRSLLLLLSILPFFWATFVAITRIEDNRHRGQDVVVGGLIGISISTICYHSFWPCPFAPKTFARGPSIPRGLYTQGDVEAQELLISQ